MKRVLPTVLITLILILAFSGCAGGNSAPVGSNSVTEFSSDKPVNTVGEVYWGNQNNGGFITETDNYIYVGTNNYRIDRKTGEAEYLCIDPTCMHKKNCISSGYLNHIMSSGERVFGRLCTFMTNGYPKYNFVELQPEGKYKPLSSSCIIDSSSDIANSSYCEAIIDNMAYIWVHERIDDDNQNVSIKIVDINTDKVEKSVSTGRMNGSSLPTVVDIRENYIYCTNDYNDFLKIDIQSGKLTKTAKNIINPLPIGDDVYFLRPHKEDEGLDLCKMDINGKNQTKLIKNVDYSYNVYGDTIYYITASYPKTLCSADISGTNVKNLYKGSENLNSIYILPKSKLLVFYDRDETVNDGSDADTAYCCGFDGSNIERLAVPDGTK